MRRTFSSFSKKNPEALVSIDLWEKVTWLSTASQFIYDEFTKVNDLGGEFVLSSAQAKIDKALLDRKSVV